MQNWFKRVVTLVKETTVEQVTDAAKKVQAWATEKWSVLVAIWLTVTGVKTAVLGWVLGAGWPTVEQVIAVTGPEFAAGVVAGAVVIAAAVTVAASGLLKAACR